MIVGTILLAAGLYFMYRQHTYPHWSNFPNGGAPVDRHVLGIFGANGFTGLLTAICGGLLLFGAAQHHLAKAMSLIVGVILGAAAIIALISGNVLGLAAANGWTELAWGIAAAILLINAMLPARRRTYETEGTHEPRRRGTAGAVGAGAAAGAVAGDVAARHRTRRAAETEDPAYAGNARTEDPAYAGNAGTGEPAYGGNTGTGTAAGAGTGTAAGAGTGPAGEPVGSGQGAPAAEGQDVNYTRRITGGQETGQPAQGEPVGVGGGSVPTQEQRMAPEQRTARNSGGGGALSRLFGRRS